MQGGSQAALAASCRCGAGPSSKIKVMSIQQVEGGLANTPDYDEYVPCTSSPFKVSAPLRARPGESLSFDGTKAISASLEAWAWVPP